MILRSFQCPLMTMYVVYDSTKVHWLSPTGGFHEELRRPLPVKAGSAARWCAGGTHRDARRTAAPWTRRSGPCTAAHGCSGPWTDIWPLLWVSSPLSWALRFPSPNFHSPTAQTENKRHWYKVRENVIMYIFKQVGYTFHRTWILSFVL